MRSVLSFPSDDRRPLSEEVSVYLTVISTDLELENLHILTPHVMLWDEGIWLLNLTACLSYWQLEAQAKCETLSQTLQRILDHMSSAHSYHAALASHPWQALLLALQLEDKGFRGLITREGRIGRNLAASLSWDIWWRCCERYVIYDATANAMTTFQQQKRAMQQAMERLTCQSPAQLKSMPVAQIQRRFGGLIASLWDMTFPSVDDRTLGRTAGTHFPWQPQVARKPLSCKRHLDFPSQDWHIIEAFLREDLNRLCADCPLQPPRSPDIHTFSPSTFSAPRIPPSEDSSTPDFLCFPTHPACVTYCRHRSSLDRLLGAARDAHSTCKPAQLSPLRR
jgi:hypothetical protein